MKNDIEILIYNGIYFIEGTPDKYEFIDGISTENKNFPNRNQLTTLDDVMEEMSEVACNVGGNAIIKFKYNSKPTFFQRIFKLGTPRVQASGIIAQIRPDEL
ncbi:MAG: hypothetical protein IKD09_05985 [Lentisphaeria bacterium]|nr:hypothetical protein [Lentisphaeria bacterium]